MSIILGIDTSCDETSVAVLEGSKTLRANIISSQVALHAPYGGVVPEIASRNHVEALSHVVLQAFDKAQIGFDDLTGVAITNSPGLIGCLLVGLSYAKALSYSKKIPLTMVHHLKAHLFSPFLEHNEVYPFLGVVVSGGHTALYLVKSFDDIACLGQTVDDAAGEAYDKVSKILGLGYPGGPIVDKLARLGDPKAFSFTRAKVKRGPYYLSFSGLKTAVHHLITKEKEKRGEKLWKDANRKEDKFVWDLLASFQNEVVESLIDKINLSLNDHPEIKAVAVSGGVAVNSRLRERLQEFCTQKKVLCLRPSPSLCTDNGAMVAYVGAKQIALGRTANQDVNAHASMPIG
ncbi:MAG: tRNA (adenosine(37)-N6)-threonylcarbamoyltransferase complex transferase subunit TsaD [Deltaproteobacteria bacterium GWA2_45_12]|nr:MAG: tRNA (adenosine(37)-N6)-threonylcarbamoyltransferase complex transferase subunit TsaD [Deltaproteobacteria bacterium GWA2_45_12]